VSKEQVQTVVRDQLRGDAKAQASREAARRKDMKLMEQSIDDQVRRTARPMSAVPASRHSENASPRNNRPLTARRER
jgi:hypothetical protein